MPNTSSAEKRMRSSQRKAVANRAVKSEITTIRRRLDDAIAGGNRNDAEKTLSVYFSILDKAAKHGVIEKNNADRRKSRATRKLEVAFAEEAAS